MTAYKEIAMIASKIMNMGSVLFLEISENKRDKIINIFNNYDIRNIEIIEVVRHFIIKPKHIRQTH